MSTMLDRFGTPIYRLFRGARTVLAYNAKEETAKSRWLLGKAEELITRAKLNAK